ncbi:serine hydrolase domain-containing protein [Wenzhouxiangella sp. EGI_FJ10305]|uniref:serine hydrolase domain-containing protein n=1 Tax=Wenzhouxiangella sp. EGI_FJ10305 TaxID=3243768 RepID=UPI0035DAF9AA
MNCIHRFTFAAIVAAALLGNVLAQDDPATTPEPETSDESGMTVAQEEGAVSTGGEPSRPTGLDDTAALEAFIDGVVEPLMKNNNSPSGTVAIARDGELIFAKGYGFEDIEAQKPVDPETTLFRPGSVSKLAAWVAVMQLVEQGELDLDTDVNEYLEEVEIPATFEEPITLRHIMTHTAGFEDGGMGYLIIEDPEKAVPLKEAMQRYRQERVNPPGAQSAYSNYATALAGLIVANVSGQPFNDYIAEHIFEPLGMDTATFEEPLPERLEDDMAVSYAFEAGGYKEKPFEIVKSFGPAGGQSASATDMVRFAQAILNGGSLDGAQILRPETVEEMLSLQFTHDDRLMGMALGWYETDMEGTRVLGHGGDTRWFHSYLGVDETHNLAFFASFGGSGGSAVRSALFPALYEQYFPREEAPPEPPEDFAERAGRYAGDYGFWRTNFSKIEKALRMSSVVKVTPGPDNTLVVGFAGNAKRYAEVGDNLFRALHQDVTIVAGLAPRLIAFQENDDGEVTGFVMDGLPFMSLRKLAPWETPTLNYALLGFAMLVFLAVLLRRFFQRATIRQWPASDRSAYRAAVLASAANWLVIISGVIVLSVLGDSMFSEISTLFKVWLVTPILAVIACLWLLFKLLVVWMNSLLAGFWARLRYTVVALCGLFVIWFYWFWNILGFQYLA